MRKRTDALGAVAMAILWAAGTAAAGGAADAQEAARRILAEAGVRGGLVVHLGCGDGTLTAALRASDAYLVHGLDADRAHVAAARRHIQSLGLYGKVAADRLAPPRLPYTDNLVNLLVADDLGAVPMAEVLRVLAPNGVACVAKGDGWTKTVKPRPKDIDEWTHYLHDATGNAVAHDARVGPPRHMQWVGAPRWARSHEHLSSLSALVSSNGRIFYIADEGLVASVNLPPKWVLAARDGFSGVALWTRAVGPWEGQLRGFRSGPAELPRRLVAIGDRVFVTLGYGKPLTALDAATGKTVKTYADTDGTCEIVSADGVLYLVAGEIPKEAYALSRKSQGPSPVPRKRRLIVLDADTGGLLWRKADADTGELLPLTLAVGGGRLFFRNTDALVCLDAKTGKEQWRAALPVSLKRPGWSTPTLVVYGDIVFTADRRTTAAAAKSADGPRQVEWVPSTGGGGRPGELLAFSAADGKKLWTGPCSETYNAPADIFLADGLLWTGKLTSARQPGFTAALDPATGKARREFEVDPMFLKVGMPHHRCHRNKATDRYMLTSKAGIEFIDVNTGKVLLHNWVRGACQYGIMPCNGLIYAPPHSCACFIKAKLNGFHALTGVGRGSGVEGRGEEGRGKEGERLETGPAFGQPLDTRPSARAPSADWPTLRHDSARTGSTNAPVPATLEALWQADLGGTLTSPTAAGGAVYVASVDTHTVHALDARDGKPRWSFTAGGRVDSPPTLHKGLALFGSADGHVYCLRAADGALAWRFRAAPEDRRIVAYDQVESVWPVHGNVMIHDGVAYFAAGRSSYLDDGIRICGLDPQTGKVVCESRIWTPDPKTGQQPPAGGFEVDGALPDVLSTDGEFLYMRHVKLDRTGAQQKDKGVHLFSPTGYLDGSWWHRSYFVYGDTFNAGWAGWWRAGNVTPAGRLLVLDDAWVYGYGRNFFPSGNAGQWRTGEYYHLFAASRDPKQYRKPPPKPDPKQKGKKGRRRRGATRSMVQHRWAVRVPIHARALTLAGRTLFLAGEPNLGHEGDEALDAYAGRKGATLLAVSADDGKVLAEHTLGALPVFDGIAAAAGRLLVVQADGKVVYLGKK